MKGFLTVVVAFLLAVPALAADYTVPDGMTDTWAEMYDDGTGTDVTSTDTAPAGAQTEFAGSSTTGTGWWNIGIGHEYIWNVDPLDLTGYTGVSVTIRNENAGGGDRVWVRAVANAGWLNVDTMVRIEGNQGWIAPGEELTSTVDLTGLDASQLQHITTIAIDVGMYADQQTWDPDGSYAGTAFDVSVVPEPATMGLLSIGLVGLLTRKRRK